MRGRNGASRGAPRRKPPSACPAASRAPLPGRVPAPAHAGPAGEAASEAGLATWAASGWVDYNSQHSLGGRGNPGKKKPFRNGGALKRPGRRPPSRRSPWPGGPRLDGRGAAGRWAWGAGLSPSVAGKVSRLCPRPPQPCSASSAEAGKAQRSGWRGRGRRPRKRPFLGGPTRLLSACSLAAEQGPAKEPQSDSKDKLSTKSKF